MVGSAGFFITKDELLDNFWGILEQSVDKYYSKDLVITKSGSLTFSHAWSNSNLIYRHLKSVSKLEKVSVGIFARDPRVIIPCMLGAMKANDHFVILDVTFPKTTLETMISDSEIKIILTSNQFVAILRSIVEDSVFIIDIDALNTSPGIATPQVVYSPEDTVQILYTSGSTGKPKGVIEDYRYLVRSLLVRREAYNIEPTDKILRLTSLANTGPHLDAFITLFTGATLFFHDLKVDGFHNLPDWIWKHEITIFSGPPTTFRSFIEVLKANDTFPSIRFFGTGGEKRIHSDMVAVKRHFPNVKQVGLSYGSTEMPFVATSSVSIDKVLQYDELPSGRPYKDLKVFIQDNENNVLPQGVEGEIVVYGDALARGYLNEPELTKTRFIQDPSNPGWQYFRTGDIGKILDDGELMHLGRLDKMVKIRGVRIEIDSIEKIILGFEGIIRVASKVFTDKKGMKKLAVYFTSVDNISVPKSDLRKTLAEKLPIQQLPSYLIQLNSLPITSSGKIDFEKLPSPQMVRPNLQNLFILPSNNTEMQLTTIWEDCIGITGIGVTDDYYDIGGDSLTGAIIFEAIEETFGVILSLSTLLIASTIQELAKIIDNKNKTGINLPVIPINPSGSKPPLFFIPGKGGFPIRIRHLAKKFDIDTPIYAFQNMLQGSSEENLKSVEHVSRTYLATINQMYPSGRIVLIGESLGGKIAYEVAMQAVGKREILPTVFLLDSFNDDLKPEPYRVKGGKLFYRMILRKHASIWFKSSWEGKKEYLRFYYENYVEKINKVFRLAAKKVHTSTSPALPKKYKTIEEEYIKATALYSPRPYPGKVILIKALRGSENTTPDNGWQKVGISNFFIEDIDCYHGSILFEPAVSELANIIQSHIK